MSDILRTMDYAADEVLDELERIEATLDDAVARAGDGWGPDFERRMGTHLRSLRPILDTDQLALVVDALEAAQRVMVSAEPEVPLRMLAMARDTLRTLLRRLADGRAPRAA